MQELSIPEATEKLQQAQVMLTVLTNEPEGSDMFEGTSKEYMVEFYKELVADYNRILGQLIHPVTYTVRIGAQVSGTHEMIYKTISIPREVLDWPISAGSKFTMAGEKIICLSEINDFDAFQCARVAFELTDDPVAFSAEII